MGLSINDTAPDFQADTTQGEWKSVKPCIRIGPQPK